MTVLLRNRRGEEGVFLRDPSNNYYVNYSTYEYLYQEN